MFSSQLCFLLCSWTEVGVEQAALHRQQSLPHRPVIPLVARMADQNTSGTPAMTEREASRLDKFRQVLAGPNTDLGKELFYGPVTWFLDSQSGSSHSVYANVCFWAAHHKNIHVPYSLQHVNCVLISQNAAFEIVLAKIEVLMFTRLGPVMQKTWTESRNPVIKMDLNV